MTTVVYCEAGHRHALELIAKARTLSSEVIALCEDEAACGACLAAGADRAALLPLAPDDCAQGDAVAAALYRLAPDSVLFPATVRGRFLSGWAAARLQTGLTADCTALGVTPDGLLLQSRPAFGGNIMADIKCPDYRPQMSTVRPNVFKKVVTTPNRMAQIVNEMISVPAEASRVRIINTHMDPPAAGMKLDEAEVVIAGGRGMKNQEGFNLLETLAGELGGTVGASRAAIDLGLKPKEQQIGQSGVTVSAKLYVACAISGAVQHVVGMEHSDVIIGINKDANAPIFNVCKYGLVGDAHQILPRIIEQVKNAKK